MSRKQANSGEIQRAVNLYNDGKFKAARQLLQRLLKQDANDLQAHFYLALCFYDLQKYPEALHHAKVAKKIAPRHTQINLNLGCIYEKMGNTSSALRHYKQELKVNPFSPEALYNIGILYYGRGQYALALPFLEKCYSLRHSLDDVVPRLGVCYFKNKETEMEIQLYVDRLQDHPDDSWTRQNLGAALMDVGQFNRALIQLRKAQSLDPKSGPIKRNIERIGVLRRSRKAVQAEPVKGVSD